MSLVSYRDWRERTRASNTLKTDPNDVAEVSDTKDAMLCGKCRRVMTKYRVSSSTSNKIDFCSNCEDVWLDAGEWELIEALAGSQYLSNIIAQPWQFQVMSDAVEESERTRLKQELGDDYEKVVELGEVLKDHPAKLEILAYLTSRSS